MVVEVLQTHVQVLRLFGIVNGQNKEVDEPGQGVLVHGLNVRQVCDGKEQNGGVDSNWSVTHSSCVNLLLSFFSNGLGAELYYTIRIFQKNFILNFEFFFPKLKKLKRS